jgi:hypothetical protein
MAGADNETKVGVVPFARHVNLGMSRAGEAWLQIDANGVWNENVCTVDAAAATASGCSEVASTCYWDGAPYSCMLWQCPSGDPPQTCSITSHVTSWYGCVGSRDHPLNIEDRDYASDPVPGVNNAGGPDCPTEVTPMTTSKSTVQNAINAMTVGGDTYIAGGLFWGQALISHEEPFAEGKSYEDLQAEGRRSPLRRRHGRGERIHGRNVRRDQKRECAPLHDRVRRHGRLGDDPDARLRD